MGTPTHAADLTARVSAHFTNSGTGAPVAVSSASPLPVGTATQTVLNSAAVDVKAAGQTADLDVTGLRELAVVVNLSVLSGGTAPTVTFFLERKDSAGNYVAIWSPAAVSATGVISTSVGAGLATAQSIGATVRLRWTSTGAPTTATASLSVVGK